MSTFSSIELGKRSLQAHTQAVQTAGHNISNSSIKGFTRQRVNLESFHPLYRPDLSREERPGQIGQGVAISSIMRLRDEILDSRIIASVDDKGYWEARDKYIASLESIYNEPDETSLRTRFDEFWDAWQELSLYPESNAARQVVKTRAETLTDTMHLQYKGLQGVKDMLEGDIVATVKEVNDLTRRIALLNQEITKVKAMGDSPNDLQDTRDIYTEKLASLIDISVDKRDGDEAYVIHTAGLEIVQGGEWREFNTLATPYSQGYSDVVWADSGKKAHFESGRLAALIGLRDVDVRDEMRALDTIAVNFLNLVNDVHKEATSPNGKTGINFFTEEFFIDNTLGNYDASGDGEYDHSYIFKITGSNKLNNRQQVGLRGVITLSAADGNVEVVYNPTDRVQDIVDRINTSGAEVTASLDSDGRLNLKASTAKNRENPDFVIRHISDSSSFLTTYAGVLKSSGEAGAFTWDVANAVDTLRSTSYDVSPIAHPAAWMEVNPVIKSDIQNIATGYAGRTGTPHPSDNRAAVAIASIRTQPVMVAGYRTFDEAFAQSVVNIGLKGEQAEIALNVQEAIVKELEDMRDSVSGVNIDEELSDIVKFQHGYNASTRFISVVNDMLDTVINKMGV